jgi:HAMP domain-containing protein
MKALAGKSWLTQTYKGSDPSGTVEIPLSEFGAVYRAFGEAVHELERLYGSE